MLIDWKNIDTVLLDMDGTLLDLHFDNYFWRQHVPGLLAQKHEWSVAEAKDRLYPKFRQTMGTLEWYCVDYWSDELELDIMLHKAEVAHKIAYRPNAQLFLEQCQRESNDVRLITNAHRKVLNLKIKHTQLDQYFDQMVCSHELSYPKEQLQFWENLQAIQAFDPARSLFLDDSETVLCAAEQYGIGHVYSIAKPDSQSERAEPSRFEMIGDFVQ